MTAQTAFVTAATSGLALGGTWLFLFPFSRWLIRQDVVDIPNARSSHRLPTPVGGGLLIVLFTLLGLLAGQLILSLLGWLALFGYIAGAVLIAGVSWIDDLHHLPNRIRFSVHLIGTLLAILAFGYWQRITLPWVGTIALPGAAAVVTIFWIVGLTNVFNFMDGIDGIAGSQGVIAGAGWLVLGAITGQAFVALMGALLASTCLGFLAHNWAPARVFMGDVASSFLGFSFAVLAVVGARQNADLPVAGALLLWPFLFDATFTLARRLMRRENIFAAHRSHLYQRLVIVGFSHQSVSIAYVFLYLVGLCLAVIWTTDAPFRSGVLLLVPLLSFALWQATRVCEQRSSATAR
ncbi:MAG TPA: UDP-phosphate alpha-N-acetylglucosaminyl 1-phosphate transferase [Chloroflexi bacterium]|jgi:UDP-N-acetylmuramyl pentapeptide phosphotransferase/UDP-N-acetylglucosamine-1-phosphate transferase|nr:UDP-phosphate alpha-N-acetylglucosaminyl 1-phosphate transferase [Chloroflexota bacterium]